jgi:hypothetical protein
LPTVTSTPATPLPNRPFRITATATHGGESVRLWCTDAPRGSSLRAKLDTSGAARIALATLESGKSAEFTFERGGGYVLALEEMRFGSEEYGRHFRGDYEGDTRGALSPTLLQATTTTLYLAEEFSSQLGHGADRATLVLHVHGDTIMRARKDAHGIVSPRVDLPSQPTAKAQIAAESAEVRLALTLMVDDEAGNFPPLERVLGDRAAVVDSLIGNLNFHLHGSGNHVESASGEQVPNAFRNPTSNAGMVASLSRIKETIDRHIRNDDGEGGGTGSANWHNAISWDALPVVSPTEQTIDACLADLCRAYALHVDNEEAHEDGEAGGVKVDLFQHSILLWMHEHFLRQVTSASPTAPANANPLAAALAARGFARTA